MNNTDQLLCHPEHVFEQQHHLFSMHVHNRYIANLCHCFRSD